MAHLNIMVRRSSIEAQQGTRNCTLRTTLVMYYCSLCCNFCTSEPYWETDRKYFLRVSLPQVIMPMAKFTKLAMIWVTQCSSGPQSQGHKARPMISWAPHWQVLYRISHHLMNLPAQGCTPLGIPTPFFVPQWKPTLWEAFFCPWDCNPNTKKKRGLILLKT